jgi:hypothetical protein
MTARTKDACSREKIGREALFPLPPAGVIYLFLEKVQMVKHTGHAKRAADGRMNQRLHKMQCFAVARKRRAERVVELGVVAAPDSVAMGS